MPSRGAGVGSFQRRRAGETKELRRTALTSDQLGSMAGLAQHWDFNVLSDMLEMLPVANSSAKAGTVSIAVVF